MSIEQYPEQHELPKKPDIIVDFFRHGKPEYTEEEKLSGNFEGHLTEEGSSQVKQRAEELAKQIDPNAEIIVIWSSPKNRALETSEIIKQVFTESEIPMLHEQSLPSKHSSLRDIKTEANDLEDSKNGNPFWDAIYFANETQKKLDSGKPIGFDRWLEFWIESFEKGGLPEKTETPIEFKKRSVRVLTYLERIARKVHSKEGKHLRFVVVGHEEGVRDLLEESFGFGTEKGTGPTYAEIVKVGIHVGEKESKFDISFREQNTRLSFNRENRTFIKVEG